MARVVDWEGIDQDARLRLTAAALDAHDERFDKMANQMNKVIWALATAALSMMTVTITIALTSLVN